MSSEINHDDVVKSQQKAFSHNEENLPSQINDTPWVYAINKTIDYPSTTNNEGGKWMVMVYREQVDSFWLKIKESLLAGQLGREAKSSTKMPNPNSPDPRLGVIIVYTNDAQNEPDVMRVREVLRNLGVTWKIGYKTDNATLRGQYNVRGKKRVSLYYC